MKIVKYLLIAFLCFCPFVFAADVKFSELPAVTSVIGADILAVVSGGATSQITVTNFLKTTSLYSWSANVLTMLGSANNAEILSNIGAQASATACTPTEIDASSGSTAFTATQLKSCNATTVKNTGQAAADINHPLPAAAANLSFMAYVGTAQGANYWRITANDAGTIYLNGSATGKDYVQYTTPAAGNYFSCFTADIGGSYKWLCADGVGTLATN